MPTTLLVSDQRGITPSACRPRGGDDARVDRTTQPRCGCLRLRDRLKSGTAPMPRLDQVLRRLSGAVASSSSSFSTGGSIPMSGDATDGRRDGRRSTRWRPGVLASCGSCRCSMPWNRVSSLGVLHAVVLTAPLTEDFESAWQRAPFARSSSTRACWSARSGRQRVRDARGLRLRAFKFWGARSPSRGAAAAHGHAEC